jgi:hypothetical protein
MRGDRSDPLERRKLLCGTDGFKGASNSDVRNLLGSLVIPLPRQRSWESAYRSCAEDGVGPVLARGSTAVDTWQ